MKEAFRFLKVVFLSLTVNGCHTTPADPYAIRFPPSDRLVDFQEKSETRTGTIVVTRDQGFIGAGCYYAISINGSLAGRLAPSETAHFYVEPGEVLLKVGRDPLGKGLCGLDQEEWTQRETMLRAGEMKFFRLLLMDNGKADIQRTH